MMTEDPRARITAGPMTRPQVLVVAITLLLTALDGFDVLSISFAAPGIAHDWGIDRAALGIVLSMELFGMAAGSILIGGLADRIGRRPVVLGCLIAMTSGMALAATATGVGPLSVWRILTGLGIGGLLAAGNAVAAEFASDRRRDLCVALMAIGYPLGAITGGSVVAAMLRHSNWRVIFEFGAIATASCLPLVWFALPESVPWLVQRQPRDALARVNRSLRQMGLPGVAALPPAAPSPPQPGLRVGVLRPGFARTSILLVLTYFLHITAFYYLLKWVPKIVVDMGFTPATAAGVLVWTNVGGFTGGAVLGILTRRFEVRGITLAMLVASSVTVALFGSITPDLTRLSLVCAAAGFCTNGAIVGLYAVLARAYPPELRASGTGVVVGVGRGGSVLAPIIAGFLFQAGYGLPVVSLCMGLGPLLAAVLLSRWRPVVYPAAQSA